jgi:predicted ATPase
MTLIPALTITKGYAAPDVEQACTRARELCQQMEESLQIFHPLYHLSVLHLVRAELKTARTLGEQLVRLAPRQDPIRSMIAHHALGGALFFQGELTRARKHLEQGIVLYHPQTHAACTFDCGQDPGVICLSHAALTLWHLGYPDQALQRSNEALALARELSHPMSQAAARFFAAWLRQARQEARDTQEQAEATMKLANEQGFTHWFVGAMELRGWALVAQKHGQDATMEGMKQIRQGQATAQAMGAKLACPQTLALLAEAHEAQGQTEEALRLVTEALLVVATTGERWCEAELLRLKGELLRKQAMSEAEACFHQARDLAHDQQAKSLELRAVMSLARLWQQQGRCAEAWQLLAEVYGWFTEGFDTADLQEAKVLLEELKE